MIIPVNTCIQVCLQVFEFYTKPIDRFINFVIIAQVYSLLYKFCNTMYANFYLTFIPIYQSEQFELQFKKLLHKSGIKEK